jgi:co-chaperonin GroES (HSP10)
MKLLGNRLLVKPVLVKQSLGGILLPEASQELWHLGSVKMFDVLQVAPRVEAQPGDRVLCQSYTDGALQLDDGTAIMDERLVLAILPKDKRYEI